MRTIDNLNAIRDMLCDEESKNIYDKILYFRLTHQFSFLHELEGIVRKNYSSYESVGLYDLIEKNREVQEDKIVIFGGALFAGDIIKMLEEYSIEVSCLCDNDLNKQKNGFTLSKYYDVLSPHEACIKYPTAKFVITAIDWHKKHAMKKELIERGIKDENISFALDYYGVQYFDDEIIKPLDDEVFIDCGSLDCMTSLQFAKWARGNYKHIYSFEPDEKNRENCSKTIDKFNMLKVSLVPCGAWSSCGQLNFVNANGGSCIDENGDSVIDVVSIDEVLQGKKATFIKMDIEGAELEALKGAEKTIRKWHPRLAISIYHKPEDLYEIPEYINELSDDYKFYIRHYSSNIF